MQTEHRIIFSDAAHMTFLVAQSVDLVVTSPPYPMIEMWDGLFTADNAHIAAALKSQDGPKAFEMMHRRLDAVWDEVWRVLKPGGIACINIGDASRTLGDRFALYPNHSRIQQYLSALGFSFLPAILWRKQTNAPNKFMGSGMLPPGAYVTLEHEYILIARKGGKREFTSTTAKQKRQASAYFWEERNQWFSDVWFDLKGTRQRLFEETSRGRSAAFPFELPYRLINMFSVKEDLVLDPFLGVGTTALAAMTAGRNFVGYELESEFETALRKAAGGMVDFARRRISQRLNDHLDFVRARYEAKGAFKYLNRPYGFPVITNQETRLCIENPVTIQETTPRVFCVDYAEDPQEEFVRNWQDFQCAPAGPQKAAAGVTLKKNRPRQGRLFVD